MTNKPMMKCGHTANAVTGDNKPACAICGCTELSENEFSIEDLLAELEAYRWRDKKALILNKFGYRLRLDEYDRKEKLEAYEKQKWVTFIKLCFLWDEVDDLMLQGCTFDEIVRAIKEHIAETLADETEEETQWVGVK